MLKSAELQEECRKYAGDIAGRAGAGYAVETRMYPERAGAVVKCATGAAIRDNLKNNTLLKAVGK